jgi:hypothetical protein
MMFQLIATVNFLLCALGLWVVLCRANVMSESATLPYVRAIYTGCAMLFVASAVSPTWGPLVLLVMSCASTSALILILLESWLDGPPSYTMK